MFLAMPDEEKKIDWTADEEEYWTKVQFGEIDPSKDPFKAR
jgi:hypothetical protein